MNKLAVVRLTALEEILGMTPTAKELVEQWVAQNAPDAESFEDEIGRVGVDGVVADNMTVFPRTDDGQPMMWDYQIRGMFKDACGMLRRVPGTASADVKAYKKLIDGTIFVHPRHIPIVLPPGGKMGKCDRPLRAQTPQGERICLASSETVPIGSHLVFQIQMLNDDDWPLVKEWLNYGKLRGLGQWRNSGKGIYTWEEMQ